jgi:hypothetical protein
MNAGREARAPAWRAAALALALALPFALGGLEWHVVPTRAGVWRGLVDPPSTARVLAALGGGALVAWLLRGSSWRACRPLLACACAALPFVPLLGGQGLVLLGLQRPLLWAVIAAAAAVSALRLAAERGVRWPAWAGRRRSLVLIALGWAFFGWLGRHLPGPAGPQGDEPHYLLQAESLASDGDIDLADEYDQRAYRAFFAGTLEAHTSPRSPRGVLYEVHAPGLPALILPAYALSGYPGVKLFLALLAALTAALVESVARRVSGSPHVALGAWAVLVAAPPLPIYAQAVYPELPAALATAVFLWAGRRPASWGSLLGAGAMAAALPWMHPKFLPLALVGLTLALLRPAAHARAWVVRSAAALLVAASCAGLLACFHALFGQASLAAAYGPRFASDVSLARLPWGLPALFFDRQFGLLTVAPVWALALPGLGALAATRTGDALRALLLAAATLGVGASFSMWWGGACPPGRFVVPALPALALLLVPAWQRRREAVAALGAVGLALTLLAADTPRALHNRADGESGLLRFLVPSLDLDAAFPSFIVGGSEAPLLALTLAALLMLGWARGARGLAAGLAAYALVSGLAWRAPLVDARTSVARLLDAWDPARVVPVSGALDLSSLSLPLDLPRAPWTLRRGDECRSRRVALPPGRYRLEIDAAPGPTREAVHLTRLEAQADDLALDWAYLRVDRPLAAMDLLLPAGAPRFVLVASGVADEGVVTGARLVPLALVPRGLREGFVFPLVLSHERYRVGDERLRVTAVDRSLPEGGGFRLDGDWGQFLLEVPSGTAVRVRVRRAAGVAGGVLAWATREVPLPEGPDVTLDLRHTGGARLGDVEIVPVWIGAAGAWVGFKPLGVSPHTPAR